MSSLALFVRYLAYGFFVGAWRCREKSVSRLVHRAYLHGRCDDPGLRGPPGHQSGAAQQRLLLLVLLDPKHRASLRRDSLRKTASIFLRNFRPARDGYFRRVNSAGPLKFARKSANSSCTSPLREFALANSELRRAPSYARTMHFLGLVRLRFTSGSEVTGRAAAESPPRLSLRSTTMCDRLLLQLLNARLAIEYQGRSSPSHCDQASRDHVQPSVAMITPETNKIGGENELRYHRCDTSFSSVFALSLEYTPLEAITSRGPSWRFRSHVSSGGSVLFGGAF